MKKQKRKKGKKKGGGRGSRACRCGGLEEEEDWIDGLEIM